MRSPLIIPLHLSQDWMTWNLSKTCLRMTTSWNKSWRLCLLVLLPIFARMLQASPLYVVHPFLRPIMTLATYLEGRPLSSTQAPPPCHLLPITVTSPPPRVSLRHIRTPTTVRVRPTPLQPISPPTGSALHPWAVEGTRGWTTRALLHLLLDVGFRSEVALRLRVCVCIVPSLALQSATSRILYLVALNRHC